jgi:hypothetical protein
MVDAKFGLLFDKIQEAKVTGIHALVTPAFPSWQAYVADVIGKEMPAMRGQWRVERGLSKPAGRQDPGVVPRFRGWSAVPGVVRRRNQSTARMATLLSISSASTPPRNSSGSTSWWARRIASLAGISICLIPDARMVLMELAQTTRGILHQARAHRHIPHGSPVE